MRDRKGRSLSNQGIIKGTQTKKNDYKKKRGGKEIREVVHSTKKGRECKNTKNHIGRGFSQVGRKNWPQKQLRTMIPRRRSNEIESRKRTGPLLSETKKAALNTKERKKVVTKGKSQKGERARKTKYPAELLRLQKARKKL